MPNDKEMNGTRALAHADVRSPTNLRLTNYSIVCTNMNA